MNGTGNQHYISAETVPIRLHNPSVREHGFVYFATDGELTKIGFSKTPIIRVLELRSPRTNKQPEMICFFRGCRDEETNLHRRFGGLMAYHWEWFRDDGRIAELISTLKKCTRSARYRRLSINDIIVGRGHLDFEVPNDARFEAWAEGECCMWPGSLQALAFKAANVYRGRSNADLADVQRFADEYKKWLDEQ